MNAGRAANAIILGDRSMHGSIQSPVRTGLFVAAACAVLTVGTATSPTATFSADAPATPAAKAPADTTSSSTTTPAKPAEAKRGPVVARRVEFVSAILLWFAVVFFSLGLLVMVMIWGRRLRNAVRRQPPASTVPDPFWYLKKNPRAVAHANQSDRSEDSESGPDAEGRPSP